MPKKSTHKSPSKKCPHCGSPVKKIRGRNTYYCKEHGFISANSQPSSVSKLLRRIGL